MGERILARLINDYTLEELNDELDMGHEWYLDDKFYTDAERTDILRSTYDESTQDYSFATWIERDDLFESVEGAVSALEESETLET